MKKRASTCTDVISPSSPFYDPNNTTNHFKHAITTSAYCVSSNVHPQPSRNVLELCNGCSVPQALVRQAAYDMQQRNDQHRLAGNDRRTLLNAMQTFHDDAMTTTILGGLQQDVFFRRCLRNYERNARRVRSSTRVMPCLHPRILFASQPLSACNRTLPTVFWLLSPPWIAQTSVNVSLFITIASRTFNLSPNRPLTRASKRYVAPEEHARLYSADGCFNTTF